MDVSTTLRELGAGLHPLHLDLFLVDVSRCLSIDIAVQSYRMVEGRGLARYLGLVGADIHILREIIQQVPAASRPRVLAFDDPFQHPPRDALLAFCKKMRVQKLALMGHG